MRAVAVVLMAALLGASFAGCTTAPPPAGEPVPDKEPRAAVAFPGATIETDLGSIVLVLYPRLAPKTVANFERLATAGYYDGKSWHRVIDDFVIQTGEGEDPTTVPLETSEEGYFSGGAVGLARGTEPDSGGPQFFITDHASPHLRFPNGTTGAVFGSYTVFGQVVAGMETVRKIAQVRTLPGLDQPVDPVLVSTVTLHTVRVSAEAADALPFRTTDRQETGGYRISLEMPRALEAGRGSNLTWYASPRDPPALGPLASPSMRIDGPSSFEVTLTKGATDAGVLSAHVTFPSPGEWTVRLLDGGRGLAVFTLDVE